MHRVVVLALDGVYPFELGIPGHVFGLARDPDGAPLYEVLTCTVDGRPVRSEADFAVAVGHGAEVLATADTVVIPASNGRATATCAAGHLPAALAAAFDRIRPGARLMAICTGAYVLAAAGKLDGRPATTHWRKAEHLQLVYPRVKVQSNVLFVDDGDVLTSAGAVAGIDLCLHVLRRDHGPRVANAVARSRMVSPWPDGDPAGGRTDRATAAKEGEATTALTRAWALDNLDRPLTLDELARHAHMSRRTFTRRFRDEVGTSPGQWLTQQRVELARHLLEATDLTVDQVAERSGFGTATSLRQHLQAATGISPAAYRRTFRVVRAMAPTV